MGEEGMSTEDEFKKYEYKPSGEERELTPEDQHAQDCARSYLFQRMDDSNRSHIKFPETNEQEQLISTNYDCVYTFENEDALLRNLARGPRWHRRAWAWVKSWRIWRGAK